MNRIFRVKLSCDCRPPQRIERLFSKAGGYGVTVGDEGINLEAIDTGRVRLVAPGRRCIKIEFKLSERFTDCQHVDKVSVLESQVFNAKGYICWVRRPESDIFTEAIVYKGCGGVFKNACVKCVDEFRGHVHAGHIQPGLPAKEPGILECREHSRIAPGQADKWKSGI
ncbi:MAG: hypothetical protein K0U82_22915 [Planctomycetes bacterium]|nr:hypothetical protein [Planctomycetota bacterium]